MTCNIIIHCKIIVFVYFISRTIVDIVNNATKIEICVSTNVVC